MSNLLSDRIVEVIPGGLASPDEVYWLEIHNEAIKQSIPRLNESLGRMLTLTTGLAGGSLVFLKDDVCTSWGRVSAAAIFFTSLAIAVIGSIPYSKSSCHDPDKIRLAMHLGNRWKTKFLWASSLVLLFGLVTAIAGAGAKAIQGQQPVSNPGPVSLIR